MSGLLRDLVGDQGCEGTSSNPITSLFNNAVDYSRQQQLADEIGDPASLASSSGASSSIAPVLTPFTKIPTNINVGMQDKSKIRARSELLARHLFPGQTEQYIEQQLSPFFERLNLPGSTGLDRFGKQNQKTFFNLGGSASKSLSEEDMDDLSMEGEAERLDDYLEQGNVDVQAAYDKYMEYMKQTLDLGHIQKTTEKYQCAPQNPMIGNPKAFEVGVQMHQQGDLIRAIQAFEAAVQQDSQNHAAWQRLGICHAECDDDHSAILAYTQAVNADPQNLEALLQLGVSYTNELNKMRALVYLKTWLSNHPSYAQIVKQNPTEDDEENLYNYYHFQQQVLGMFNAAKQQNPQDADLYAVLGVMYNISNEYEKAVESFQNALKYRPQDYSLWNKLGATLANGSRSQEAVEAYRKALKLKPNYVRAWINLGIAYANQRQHQEAIKYYLRAISMCPKADSVWQYLGMALTCIERPDLVELCKHKDVNLFRKHFNF